MDAWRVTLAGTALIAGGLVLQSPVAGADPGVTPTVIQVPERSAPSGTQPFTNDPTIVDARAQGIESWSRLPNGNRLSVHFTTGTPECYGVDAEVQQTADIVAVKLRSGTRPEAVGKACIEIAVFGELTLDLDAPVGDRAVVSIT